ncbi:uncharacterized protein EKO05_0005984 [Ascochyta rabiei]|uniref:Uncharacterized protein n=1 Tax=Didymella rabiei TaxID=5454 RepID=A0A163MAD6_DIDRA|nr:uncharacterized protein EKO05_0005984 [Ascochyta rabiei]KZM28539.1 hypothetical protein ST47_g351 [Ascochyta rabiei]UPX15540.1 hypothetical protein EKO05_0005984 [Ascochyta rabiei]
MQTLLPYRPRTVSPLNDTANTPIKTNSVTLPSEHDLTTALAQDSDLATGTVNVATIIETSRSRVDFLNQQLDSDVCRHHGAPTDGDVSTVSSSPQTYPQQATGAKHTEMAGVGAAVSAPPAKRLCVSESDPAISLGLKSDSGQAPHPLDEPSGFATAGCPKLDSGMQKRERASWRDRARGRVAKAVALLGCYGGARRRQGERRRREDGCL